MDSDGMDSEGMDSEGMEGKPGKIFGSNSKVSNPTGSSYMFGIDSVGKYSVQIQKFQIQQVHHKCSE